LIRGIMLRDAGIGEMWIELAALGAFVVVMGIASARFRKTLD
jgi:ABC-2 type transport system permease protein